METKLCCSVNPYAKCPSCKYALCHPCMEEFPGKQWVPSGPGSSTLRCPNCEVVPAIWRTKFNGTL